MKIWSSLLAVVALVLIAWLGTGVAGLYTVFGVGIPYLAFLIFALGFIYRILKWGRSPVPFCIPTTCGQEKSLPWIKHNKIENPSGTAGVVGRMILEILFFRSLFRNLKTEKRGDKLGFGSAKWLWLGGLAFHWSMLIILLRHLRFFLDPVPSLVRGLDGLDSFLQIGLPILYITDIIIVAALLYLLARRLFVPQVRYISLASDYFPLFLLLGIVTSGILMRYFLRVDVVSVKELALGLVTLRPTVPTDIGSIFFIHVFLVSSLFAYFPWSKLMHAGGIFLSPTRNMANNSRRVRHINPWNYPVDVHSYAEYEAEFKEKMKKAGVPVETE
ncbi:Nitrate reductase gamma subunit [Acididesulfobacillus acetoxydans]|uniref:Hdr-like menaquinol oxidoreductase cytochrome b-like subunit n=1 Tax=Acididesulfobacillus acetoxydans TaxID=1561005 RepID=A0A8S0VVR9_9FIRM|nr:sulfate reduction electron transfer complex DsrMKJOP subunit DsrM [Acididesulfobacillus acetoxydans]CAA7600023.1 Nitrate reductase gamma subunit [Acididesulfobacillus acetoxydans]CEJ07798.1 Hdr-like menaquinol oxidoreductase cytochrome b-like subunit [Acididesulfobacillus acetoxydans]